MPQFAETYEGDSMFSRAHRTPTVVHDGNIAVVESAAGWLGVIFLVFALFLLRYAPAVSAHYVLGYFILVLTAAAFWRRPTRTASIGILTFALGVIVIAGTTSSSVIKPADWIVVTGFVGASIIGAQLLSRAQRHASDVRLQMIRANRVATLGARALNASTAERALEAVTELIQLSLRIPRCEVHVCSVDHAVVLTAYSGRLPLYFRRSPARSLRAPWLPDASRLVQWVAEHGRAVAECADGTMRFGEVGHALCTYTTTSMFQDPGEQRLLLPLRMDNRSVGVLVLFDIEERQLDSDGARLLAAFSWYAALAAGRIVRSRHERTRGPGILRQQRGVHSATSIDVISAVDHGRQVENDRRKQAPSLCL